MAEISIKCQICIQKFKIHLKKACSIGKLIEFFKNWMEHSEKPRNSSEKVKTRAKKLKNSRKKSRFWQIHLVYLPEIGRKKACLNFINPVIFYQLRQNYSIAGNTIMAWRSVSLTSKSCWLNFGANTYSQNKSVALNAYCLRKSWCTL